MIKVLPFRVHLRLDVAHCVLLASSPWLFQFADRVWVPHLTLGLLELGVILLTGADRDTSRNDTANPSPHVITVPVDVRSSSGTLPNNGQRLFRAAIVVGLGLGGFLDGIVLHQILGWHHLFCITESCRPDSVTALLRQKRQDGFFHLATWFLTIGGLVLVRRAPGTTGENRKMLGGALAGFGIFNFVEGLIDHQILGLHHVRPDSPQWLAYDLLFLLSGVLLCIGGRLIAFPRNVSGRSTQR